MMKARVIIKSNMLSIYRSFLMISTVAKLNESESILKNNTRESAATSAGRNEAFNTSMGKVIVTKHRYITGDWLNG